jgi:hypothetical protein
MSPATTAVATAVAALLLALVPVPGSAGAEWTVKPGETAGACRLESSPASMSDGYQQTSVYLSVTPKSVAVVAAAPLDGAAGDIGLAVDGESFIRMDRLEGDKTARFDSKYELLVAQFKAGAQVRLQLRFWPTWPATGAHSTTLSLIGFTKGYGQLSGCR